MLHLLRHHSTRAAQPRLFGVGWDSSSMAAAVSRSLHFSLFRHFGATSPSTNLWRLRSRRSLHQNLQQRRVFAPRVASSLRLPRAASGKDVSRLKTTYRVSHPPYLRKGTPRGSNIAPIRGHSDCHCCRRGDSAEEP